MIALPRTALLLLFLIGWPAAVAASGEALFTAEAPVADESVETRNTTLRELLAEVLVRVSGNAGIGGSPAAGDLLDAAPSLVQQYRYRMLERDGEATRVLWARFDGAAIERMLRERGLPVWVQRPRVLLWVATERAGQRRLLNLDNDPAGRDRVLAQAARRGMPLQLPLLDLEDQGALAPADLWSEYRPAIEAASTRYPHEQVLIGRLSAAGEGRWQGRWSLLGRDDATAFQSPPMALDDALAFAVDQGQNLLAARFAPMPGAVASGTLVRFSGIYDLPRYGRLVGLLEGLEPVSDMALRYVADDDLVFELTLRGSAADLVRALEASGQVVNTGRPLPRPVPPPATGPGAAAPVPAAPEVDHAFRLRD